MVDDMTEELLATREETHGDFATTAAVSQAIKDALRWGAGERWQALPPAAREALDGVAVKMARMVSGDWRHLDHWEDIRGYAALGHREALRCQQAAKAAENEGVESV